MRKLDKYLMILILKKDNFVIRSRYCYSFRNIYSLYIHNEGIRTDALVVIIDMCLMISLPGE